MCKHVVNALWQKYVVLTVDEAFFCKLMELKWANQQYTEFLILRHHGCLHTAMNFLKAIGHRTSGGLDGLRVSFLVRRQKRGQWLEFITKNIPGCTK